jgi:hypothetical protein
MPREFLHWVVAERAAKEFEKSSSAQQSLSLPLLSRPFLFLGAMAPDAPFFYNLGSSPLSKLSDELHGAHGENPFQKIIKFSKQTLTHEELSFLFGYLSHCAVDSLFHPWIYWETGNYYASKKAKIQHRKLETILDEWMNNQCQKEIESYKRDFRIGIQQRRKVDSILNSLEGSDRFIFKAFYHMHQALNLFRSPQAFRLLSLLPESIFSLEVRALFHARKLEEVKNFRSEITFHQPVTGEEIRTSVEELIEKSVRLSIETGNKFFNTEHPEKLNFPSLDSGMEGIGIEGMKFFKKLN